MAILGQQPALIMNDLLPGQLIYAFSVSILDAGLLSWLALAWYRRSVRRIMREGAQGSPGTAVASDGPAVAAEASTPASLVFALFEPARVATPKVMVMPEQRRAFRRLAAAYCVGAALHSAVMTSLTLGFDTRPLPVVAWFGEWWINAWPIVPTLVVLLVLDRGTSLWLAASYLLVGSIALALVTVLGQVLRGTLNTAPFTNVFWMLVTLAWNASVPLLLLLVIGWRRIRAVAPLALAATLLFGFGLLFFWEAFVGALNLQIARDAILGLSVRLSPTAVRYGLFMLVSLLIGWLAWRVLRSLAAGFEHKRFSDVQLVIDCWWLVVTAEAVATRLSGQYGLGAIVGGLAAFIAYRAGVTVMLRILSQERITESRRLLLLRVFGYEARTESLFDRVAQRWRFHGPVQLIGGVDLGTRTADPGDMLAFVSGRLDEQCVAAPEDLARRLERLDLERDPDGRFRVNEVYCHDDTWRSTLARLLDMSDTVLMDLRSFNERNAGCVFELAQLVRRVPSDRIVLVCDRTTDVRLLTSTLAGAWDVARRDGSARGTGQVALVRVEQQSSGEVNVLMRRLLGMSAPQHLFTASELPAAFA